MEVEIPIREIDTATLDSKVKNITLPPSNAKMDISRCVYFPVSLIPRDLQKTKTGNLFYLSGDVHAMTSRQYLDSVDPETKLAQLFTEKGDFYPCNPDDFQTIE